MLIDITLKITPDMVQTAHNNANMVLSGHVGTHFDVMDKEFPLDYTRRTGLVFDVSHVTDRDIDVSDIDLTAVEPTMFVAFYTGFIDRVPYASPDYFARHPQLSCELIQAFVDKGISILGIDFAGVRRGREHVPQDQYCADRGVFVIENLCDLDALLGQGGRFTACTYPMNYVGMTGLPCRVVADIP